MKDSITFKLNDTVKLKQNKNEYFVIVSDKNEKQSNMNRENPLFTSLLIPILVAFFTALITYRFNMSKNNLEIEKLKEETLNLKRSFQPIVLGTIQSIQDKIVTSKIEALKLLIQIRNNFSNHEQQYYEGDPITPDYEEYLNLLFYHYSSVDYNEYRKFHDEYSYLFPDKVFEVLSSLSGKLSDLNETKKSFNSIGDSDLEPSQRDRKEIEDINSLFENAIQAIRKDCHLDTSFIHDFIEKNKV